MLWVLKSGEFVSPEPVLLWLVEDPYPVGLVETSLVLDPAEIFSVV